MTRIENFTVRHYQPDDVSAIADLYNADWAATGDPHRVTPEEMRMYLAAPDFDAANDTFIIERDGQMVAYGQIEFNPETGRSWSECAVDPRCAGQGLGTLIVQTSEARALARAQAEMPPERPLQMQRFSVDSNTAALRLFEEQGYYHVRTFYRMLIDLDQPLTAPPLPDGLVLRPFDRERDAEGVYAAHQEAFADHWGFERDSYETWAYYVLGNPNYDPSLWLIAYDGEQIAGICVNRPYGEEDPQLAWVGNLAVRRPWRKRGLGSALLRHSFALFQERGYQRAGLGVDAASLTNAVALYERAGMRVSLRTLAYRKMLRGVDADEAAGHADSA